MTFQHFVITHRPTELIAEEFFRIVAIPYAQESSRNPRSAILKQAEWLCFLHDALMFYFGLGEGKHVWKSGKRTSIARVERGVQQIVLTCPAQLKPAQHFLAPLPAEDYRRFRRRAQRAKVHVEA